MRQMPRDPLPDATLALLTTGYPYIMERCKRFGSDVFRARLLLQPTICMSGPEAAKVFHDENHFVREGAAPMRAKKTLFGVGGVQGLDGEQHRSRKAMLMAVMKPERIAELEREFEAVWRTMLERWATADSIVLFDEMEKVLSLAVHRWAGVPIERGELEQRTRTLVALIEGAGAVGPQHLEGRLARRRVERRLASLIEQVRAGAFEVPADRALALVAAHRDPDGSFDARLAAVDLLNILRPTVAVARYVVFAALALHENPAHGERIRAGDDEYLHLFVQEVRRFFPFFPFTAARVRADFEWNGYLFEAGTRTLFDLYGTNRDVRVWEQPERFLPERFRDWDQSPFNFVPQGGGDHFAGHRCAGEWITIALLKKAVHLLAREMRYRVPEQDLRLDVRTLPASPPSRFVMTDVRPAAGAFRGEALHA